MMSSSLAKEVAVPGASSIVFVSSWEYGCDLGVPKLLLARQFDCVEPRSRLCLAFRFFARLVMLDSNWVRFGPQSLPALVHLMHFSCMLSSHLRSGGLHYPPSDLRLGKTSKLTSCTTGAREAAEGQNWGWALATHQTEWRKRKTPHFLFCNATRITFFVCFRACVW